MDYAHRRRDERDDAMDIVHRDVSPQNILLGYEGGVKIADFGIAKAKLVSEEAGVIKGKFSYMSPEQARGEPVDRRSDVYSLGVVFAELLMGRSMYPDLKGLDVLERVRLGRVEPPATIDPSVPAALDAIARRAMAADREERHQTARSLAGAIAQYLHHQQELVEAETLEAFVRATSPREQTRPGDVAAATDASLTLRSRALGRDRGIRRRVVVLAGHLRSLDGGGSEGEEPGSKVRDVLEHIAYKADAVLKWSQEDARRFQLIIGLGRASLHDPLTLTRLALDVLDALSGLSADSLRPLSASLGLSRGALLVDRDAAGRLLSYRPVGSVLRVAEDLAEAGGPDEILASGEVYRLARREFAFEEDAREVEVVTEAGSGPRGIRAHRLRGALTRGQKDQARHLLSDLGLIGRDASVEALRQLHREAVRAPRTAFVALLGALGVGKSALIGAALERLDPAPRVLRAECPFGEEEPLGAIAGIVREACQIPDHLKGEEARQRLHACVDDLFPEQSDRSTLLEGLLPLVVPEERDPRGRADDASVIMRAVLHLIRALSLQRPTWIWVDSLQWCDSASLELLRLMRQRSYDVPCVVLLAGRLDSRLEPVLEGVTRLDLGELDREDSRQLVRARFGASVPPSLEQEILDRAGGNPLFLIELVDALLERGAVELQGSGPERRVICRPGAGALLPATLQEVIGARIDELGELERCALSWLAVAGSGLRASDVSSLERRELADAIADLLEKGLLADDPGRGLLFANPVVRQVAYEATEPRQRLEMHRRVAQRLSESGMAAPGRIARHLAASGDDRRAAEAFLDAASAALDVYSNLDALRYFARALELLPADTPRRFEAHLGRERIFRFLGRAPERVRELEQMRRIAEAGGDLRIRAIRDARQARFELDSSQHAAAEALLGPALEAAVAIADRALELDVLRLVAETAREQGQPIRALEACDRALGRAGLARPNLPARGALLVQRGIVLRRMGRLDDAVTAYTEAIVIFRRLKIRRSEAFAYNSLGVALAAKGWDEDAIAVIRASIRIDSQIGDRLRLGRKLSNVGQLYSALGDLDTATAFVRRALDVFEVADDGAARADALSAMAEILLERGSDLDAVQTHLDGARRVAERLGDGYMLARERIVRCQLERARGDAGAAARAAREGVTLARRDGVAGYELHALALLSELALELGEEGEAGLAADELSARLQAGASVERSERLYLTLARTFVRLDRPQEAQAALEAARQVVEHRGAGIRTAKLRERYLETAEVRAIRALEL
ncbi:MAG: protein kinase [Myxococcales bacterium]|nr:protein kinase [Myxococcales bacterium]